MKVARFAMPVLLALLAAGFSFVAAPPAHAQSVSDSPSGYGRTPTVSQPFEEAASTGSGVVSGSRWWGGVKDWYAAVSRPSGLAGRRTVQRSGERERMGRAVGRITGRTVVR